MSDDDTIEFPPVSPGIVVLIQIKDAGYWVTTDEGKRVFHRPPSPPALMTIHERDECWPDAKYGDSEVAIDASDGLESQHQMTICLECIPSWAQDYYISLPDTPATLGMV
jgi:hypothetical protein